MYRSDSNELLKIVPKNYVEALYNSYTFTFVREKCPRCHVYNTPFREYAITHETANYGNILSVFTRCSSCGETYIATFRLNESSICEADRISLLPINFVKVEFNNAITNLSKGFTIIYNQSHQAEQSGLDQIAGMGYRKAIEFLIKDFAIYNNPDKKDSIKSMPLSQCIKNYIDNHMIKSLAEKTAWLGNDETHYIRKHTDRDITDLKKFIEATAYFISMSLIAADAETVSPQ